MGFFPCFLTQASKFVFWHITARMIVVNVINILKVLGEQTYKVCILSYRLPGKFEIVLSQIEAVDVRMSTTT